MFGDVSDDELDQMFEEQGHPAPEPIGMELLPQHQQPAPQPAPMQMAPLSGPGGIHLYPIPGLGQPVPTSPEARGLLTRKFLGLPVWGWGIGIAAVAGGAWWWTNQQKASHNPEPAPPEPMPIPEETGWSPSRSRFGEVIRRHFQRRGITDKAHVYTDADDAKRKLKHVSPLITIKVDAPYKVDKDLEKLCRREGLRPIVHEDATIGLYPVTGKRGQEWERYIDALRDDGQTV